MFKTAFSTVACPDWTIEQACRAAAEWGYDGIEFRTFGPASTQFACDPALTSSEKVRRLLGQSGVEAAVVASSVGFGEPIRPAVIGRVISDTERSIRDAKAAIELAAQIESPLVRVFGFEWPRTERRKSAIARITERLRLAADAARNTGVKLVLENGGCLSRAEDLAEVIAETESNLVGAAYSVLVGRVAGDDPAAAIRALGDKLWVCKLRDRDEDHQPCLIGQGEAGIADAVRALDQVGFAGWTVVEWDRAWITGLQAPDEVLPAALESLYQWRSGVAARTRV